MTPSQSRAQRLVDEFEEGASFLTPTVEILTRTFEGVTSIRHGIARVLRHLADTEAGYADPESWYAVPARTLEDLADTLEAPTLLDRALAGDAAAALDTHDRPPLVRAIWSDYDILSRLTNEELKKGQDMLAVPWQAEDIAVKKPSMGDRSLIPSRPPLLELIPEAFTNRAKELGASWHPRYGFAAEIRALRDWLVPEEAPCPEEAGSLDMAIEALLRDERQRLRSLLTAEAELAELL